LPSGAMRESTAWRIGFAAFGVGAICGIWFLYEIGWTLLPLFAAGAVCVLGYTDFLARRGVGEIAAGFGLGALPVAGAAMVQDGTLGPAAIAVSLPAFFMTFNLLLLNEFPDEEADREGGRRNLVNLLGRKGAARVYALAAVLTPVSIAAAVVTGVLPVWCALGVLPSVLLIPPLRWALGNPDRAVPVPALGMNVVWNLATNLTLAVTLVVAAS